ncbi:hypothetical protein [Shimia sp.]|uniref:hypothetical protein n=1 Tax=Shimia sp. TaxID=1954381 RepID=UPI003BA9A1B6
MAKLTMTSPKGVAVYPRLDKPDTKFDEHGIYKADIKLPEDEGKAFIKAVKAKAAEDGISPKMVAKCFSKVLDDDEEETGEILVHFRVKNKVIKSGQRAGEIWDRRPAQFDARGRPIAKHKAVAGGSVIKVSFEIYEWAFGGKSGVSLQPEAIQIIELKEWSGGGDASSYGFGAEDGYADEGAPDFGDESDDDDLDGDDIPNYDDDEDDY